MDNLETPLKMRPRSSDAKPLNTAVQSINTVWITILDTDCLMNHVRDRVRFGPAESQKYIGVYVGGRTFASRHVLDELYAPDAYERRHKWDKLAEESVKGGWTTSAETFQKTFEEEFLGSITFVDVTGMYEDEWIVEAVRIRDATDAPTAQLTVLLSRLSLHVLSHDKHLWKSGVALRPKHFDRVVEAKQHVRIAEFTINGVAVSGLTLAIVLDEAARGIAGVLHIPRWAMRLAVLGAVGWSLTDQQLRKRTMKILAPIGILLQETYTNGLNAAQVLSSVVVRASSLDGLEQRIAEIFVTHAGIEGLLATEIRDHLIMQEDLEIVPKISEIRQIIDRSPCFSELRRYRYHFSRATPSHQYVER